MDGNTSGFILTWGLLFAGQAHGTDQVKYDEYMNAARMSWEASYRQSGLKKTVDQKLKRFERKYVPKYVLKYGSATAIIVKVVAEEKLVLTWEF